MGKNPKIEIKKWVRGKKSRRFCGIRSMASSSSSSASSKSLGCGYFEWYDDALSARVNEIINDLKLENKVLLAENKQLKAMDKGVASDLELDNKIGNIWREIKSLKRSTMDKAEKA
ncbi:conserved hypothetical protein [Ricinus communis]|uniref:Uncharacterized protein n=1 Tax=Ricinus communis TaxID=3988 RepID=B9T201_RICCO|nr:conserved hypothetical protein [Ricinus communis]